MKRDGRGQKKCEKSETAGSNGKTVLNKETSFFDRLARVGSQKEDVKAVTYHGVEVWMGVK